MVTITTKEFEKMNKEEKKNHAHNMLHVVLSDRISSLLPYDDDEGKRLIEILDQLDYECERTEVNSYVNIDDKTVYTATHPLLENEKWWDEPIDITEGEE